MATHSLLFSTPVNEGWTRVLDSGRSDDPPARAAAAEGGRPQAHVRRRDRGLGAAGGMAAHVLTSQAGTCSCSRRQEIDTTASQVAGMPYDHPRRGDCRTRRTPSWRGVRLPQAALRRQGHALEDVHSYAGLEAARLLEEHGVDGRSSLTAPANAWVRARALGARPTSGPLALRLSDLDFKARATTATAGMADLLRDIEPYYDKVTYTSHSGHPEGLPYLPTAIPAHKRLNTEEVMLRHRGEAGSCLTPIARGDDGRPEAQPVPQPCFGRGSCGRRAGGATSTPPSTPPRAHYPALEPAVDRAHGLHRAGGDGRPATARRAGRLRRRRHGATMEALGRRSSSAPPRWSRRACSSCRSRAASQRIGNSSGHVGQNFGT